MSVRGNNLAAINKAAVMDPASLIFAAESRFEAILRQIARKIRETNDYKLLLVGGPSSSGKTTTAQKIAAVLGEYGVATYHLSLDDFYLPAARIPRQQNGAPDFECLHALDLRLLHETLADLMNSGAATLPKFNFQTGRRETGQRITLQKKDVLVAEGLHALNPALLGNLQERRVRKVYISISSRIYETGRGAGIVLSKRAMRLTRRILRDAQFRNAPAEETISMWPSVLAGEDRYLTPCKPYADICVNSVHLYEPCVLRDRVLPLLEAIDVQDPGYPVAGKLIRALRRFVPLPGSLVPETSLLREFLGQ